MPLKRLSRQGQQETASGGLPTFANSAVVPKAAICIRGIELAASTESCRRTVPASRPGSSPEASLRGRLRISY